MDGVEVANLLSNQYDEITTSMKKLKEYEITDTLILDAYSSCIFSHEIIGHLKEEDIYTSIGRYLDKIILDGVNGK